MSPLLMMNTNSFISGPLFVDKILFQKNTARDNTVLDDFSADIIQRKKKNVKWAKKFILKTIVAIVIGISATDSQKVLQEHIRRCA